MIAKKNYKNAWTAIQHIRITNIIVMILARACIIVIYTHEFKTICCIYISPNTFIHITRFCINKSFRKTTTTFIKRST
jgi:hypothetical protein